MLQYPLLITCPKASDYLYNKEEMDMNHNLVTESKVTKCYRMNLTVLLQALQGEWTRLRQKSFPEHVSEMPGMCPDTRRAHTLSESNDCDLISSCDIDFCIKIVRLSLLHSVTFF